ncbi:hypothetical protein FHT02_001909 [Sphingomonas xinjiangensis]|uniref:Uncharacterized protein n=1 Tax=Sphingomonas xinjiangensis TaxID=643568 RepID=A0A840YIH6_9SPHN|nr:hypothetical protein [Sphingomonas xinjiangensis]
MDASSSRDLPAWLWALIGGAAVALGFVGYRQLGRRTVEDEEVVQQEAVLPQPAPVPRKLPGISPPAEKPAVPSLPAGGREDPFDIRLRPQRLSVTTDEVIIELELLLGNRQLGPAENVRVQLTMLSANPEQDRHSAAYHAATVLGDGVVPPFDLASASGGRIPVRLSLPRRALHVVQLAAKPMFVPMVFVDVRWRSGISIRRFGADFLIGTSGQGGKLGPIWLDRPVAGPFAATRYFPKAAAAA